MLEAAAGRPVPVDRNTRAMPSAAVAFGLPGGGGGGFPGLGGGGLDAVAEQAKVRTVNSIFAEVGETAFEGVKLVVAK